nr:MAG TPA: hypothetical protein [Caudoviricetes sp.]
MSIDIDSIVHSNHFAGSPICTNIGMAPSGAC